MNINPFESKWLDEFLIVHKVSAQKGFAIEDSKLFAYLHIKIASKGIDGIYHAEDEINSLKILLGYPDSMEIFPNTFSTEKISKLAHRIREVDHANCERTGRENVMGAELQRRLRLHTDKDFQKKVLDDYFGAILPAIKLESVSET